MDLEEYNQPCAGPKSALSLDVAAANLVDNTVNDIMGFLRSRFRNFNEQQVRDVLRDFLSRKMQELG